VCIWTTNDHGGDVKLRGLDPTGFRFSLLRVCDPSTPTNEIDSTPTSETDAAESHFKNALDTRRHGLNRN
jgi:hypothetical protein